MPLVAGSGLISVCDIAICVSDAKFALEVRLGPITATISPFVVGKIGHTGARQTMLSGKSFDADTALRLGLVSKICQPNMLDNAIEAEISAILKAELRRGSCIKSAYSLSGAHFL